MSPTGFLFLATACVFQPYASIVSTHRMESSVQTATRSRRLGSFVFIRSFFLLPALSTAEFDAIRRFPPITFSPRSPVLMAAFPGAGRGGPIETASACRGVSRPLARPPVVGTGFTHGGRGRGVRLPRGVVHHLASAPQLAVGAATVCVAVFSLARYVRGWTAMGAIVLFSFAFHLLVAATGDLSTAMATHFSTTCAP